MLPLYYPNQSSDPSNKQKKFHELNMVLYSTEHKWPQLLHYFTFGVKLFLYIYRMLEMSHKSTWNLISTKMLLFDRNSH